MLKQLFGMKRDPVDMMSVTAGPTVRVLTTAFCEANIQSTGKSENVSLKDIRSCKSDVGFEMENDKIITIKVDIRIHNSFHVLNYENCELL